MARLRQIDLPWTQQPQEAVRLAPQYSDAGACLLPSLGLVDLVSGRQWSIFGAPSQGPDALGLSGRASSNGWYITPQRNLSGAAQTHIMLVQSTATTGAYAGLLASASSDGSSASMSFQRNAADSQWFYWAGATDIASTGVSKAFGPSLLVMAGDSSGAEVWVDGAQVLTSVNGPSAQSTSRIVLFGERSANTGYATSGSVWLYLGLPYRLPASEVARLAKTRPEALFAEVFAPRRIFVPMGGASLPTLSAATYMPGSLTSSGFRPRVTAS